MSHGRLLIPLLILTTVAPRAACQTAPAPAADPCNAPSCPATCAPAPRVRVIVPPPEVVFCPAAKRCCRLFHREQPCAAPCAPAAPCAAVQPAVAAVAPAMTPPGGGMISFNMNMAVPYMTYQMTPVMMGTAGFAGMGMTGMGMMGGTFGMPMAAPVGGINLGLGLGGGMQMSMGGNALAAALGLSAPAGLGASGTSAMEMQILRALLGRAAGSGTDTARQAGAADNSPEAQMRALNARITDITTQITNELANARQMRNDVNQNMRLLPMLANQIQALEKRVDAIDKGKRPESE